MLPFCYVIYCAIMMIIAWKLHNKYFSFLSQYLWTWIAHIWLSFILMNLEQVRKWPNTDLFWTERVPTLAEVGADGREGHEVSLHVHLLTALGEHLLKGARKVAAKPMSHQLSWRQEVQSEGEARWERTNQRMETSDVSCRSSSTLSTILVWNWIKFITFAKSVYSLNGSGALLTLV